VASSQATEESRMRTLVTLLLFSFAATAFAQQAHTRQLGVFVSDLGVTSGSATGTDVSGGLGVSLNYFWTRRFSTELSVADEAHPVWNGEFRARVRTTPIDATAQYHFFTSSRWQPFLGGGLHYINAAAGIGGARESFIAIGGVRYQLTRSFGLDLAGRGRFANGQIDRAWDPAFKITAGVSWRF
jgi:outer membrane protein W